MARLTDEIENGQRVVHVENEDEFYYYFDRGPITLSHELAESLGFREYPGSAEELHAEEWEETLKGEREWEELQKEWAPKRSGGPNARGTPPAPSLKEMNAPWLW